MADTDYLELLVTHQPAMERFIETLTALLLQCWSSRTRKRQNEEEIHSDPAEPPTGALKYLMEDRSLRQVPIPW